MDERLHLVARARDNEGEGFVGGSLIASCRSLEPELSSFSVLHNSREDHVLGSFGDCVEAGPPRALGVGGNERVEFEAYQSIPRHSEGRARGRIRVEDLP